MEPVSLDTMLARFVACGVEHCPRADTETALPLFEPATWSTRATRAGN